MNARCELQLTELFVPLFKNFMKVLLYSHRRWFHFSKRIVATLVVNVSFSSQFISVKFERWSRARYSSTFFSCFVVVFSFCEASCDDVRRWRFLLSLFILVQSERRSYARRFLIFCSISFFWNVRFKFISSMNSILKNFLKFFLLVS